MRAVVVVAIYVASVLGGWGREDVDGTEGLSDVQVLIAARRLEMRAALGLLWLVTSTSVCACSGLRITEDTPMAVSVRYDGVIQTLDDATRAAQTACAAHGKKAQLRTTDEKAALERFAHFNCVSG
jgi:hypothetical protein